MFRFRGSRKDDFSRFITGLISFAKAESESDDARCEDRFNITSPVMLAPWIDGKAVPEEASTALTKNFSDRGLALVMHQPLRVDQVVLGMLWFGETSISAKGEPRFALADVRQNVPLGGGFWQLGVEISRLFSKNDFAPLAPLIPLTERLRPDRRAKSLPQKDSAARASNLASPPITPPPAVDPHYGDPSLS